MKNKYTIFLTSLLFLCGSANAKTSMPSQEQIQAAITKCKDNTECESEVQKAGPMWFTRSGHPS